MEICDITLMGFSLCSIVLIGIVGLIIFGVLVLFVQRPPRGTVDAFYQRTPESKEESQRLAAIDDYERDRNKSD